MTHIEASYGRKELLIAFAVLSCCVCGTAAKSAHHSSLTAFCGPRPSLLLRVGVHSAAASIKAISRQNRREALVSLKANSDSEESKNDAKDEAERWKVMAERMEQQRASAKQDNVASDDTKNAQDISDNLSKMQGAVLPPPSMGELDSLMARAEAFKAKQTAQQQNQAADDDLPRRFQGSKARGLVGGDAGSMRQAAPYQPGESKAGASQEGWTDDQLEKILREEAKWKQQLAEKQQEEAMANGLAANANSVFTIGPGMKSEKGVPSSMENAVVQALLSSVTVMQKGCGRFRIDVDISRDETYTTLKNSIPFTRVFCKGLSVNGFTNIRIILPDPGSAALAKRDWAGPDGHNAVSFERFRDTPIGDEDDAIVVVAAAATEIEKLKTLSLAAAERGIPLILINPSVKSPGGENLGSLGAYSLGLSEFLSTFETAYYLRTISYGAIHRQYPSSFGVYEEVPGGAYTLLEETRNPPSGEQLEEIYARAHPQESAGQGLSSLAKGVGRFIKNYSRG